LVWDSLFKYKVLAKSPIVGHYVFQNKYDNINHSFFWEFMKKDINTFVVEYDTYLMVVHTTYHGAAKITPFEAIYGQSPPLVISYFPNLSEV
jgi:hypothetical protein